MFAKVWGHSDWFDDCQKLRRRRRRKLLHILVEHNTPEQFAFVLPTVDGFQITTETLFESTYCTSESESFRWF